MPLSDFIAYELYKSEIPANYLKPVGLGRAGSASGFSTNPRHHYVMGLLMKSGTLVDRSFSSSNLATFNEDDPHLGFNHVNDTERRGHYMGWS